ncbi:MAG: hypothetical protein NPIRA03_37790 [Nitrospirales bacterium]|nr:MAG: hypothetical protein NPIRA03_37790 [Nitrospirales bacterium]
MAFDGDLACFGLFNDWWTGKAVEGTAILLDWTADAVVSFVGLPSNLAREWLPDATGARWSEDSEWATTLS